MEVQNLGDRFWHVSSDGADMLNRFSGVAALARAKQRREAAVAAQTERMTAEKAAIAKAHEDAKAQGLVEKTAGESVRLQDDGD